jgi:hypothetical protein
LKMGIVVGGFCKSVSIVGDVEGVDDALVW